MLSSPGSGETTILVRTMNELKGKMKIGVIESNIQYLIDPDLQGKAPDSFMIYAVPMAND